MSDGGSQLNSRAAIWATIIVGGALAVVWLPRLIRPPSDSPHVLPAILGIPGVIVLVPGVMVTTFVRAIAYTIAHHDEIARAAAAMPASSTDTYFVVNSVGFHLSIPFVCALILDWFFYFLIARTVLRGRAQRSKL